MLCRFLGGRNYVWLLKMKVKLLSPVPLFATPWSLPGSSIHGISQARILEQIVISFSSRSSWPRDRTWVSCTAGRLFTIWATRESPNFCFFFLENVLNVVKCFFYISLDNHFFLHSFNVVYFNQFSYSLHSMNKSHLVVVCKPFSMILNLVC